MKFLAAMALLFGCVTFTAHAQPHPETGIEYWAIQATPETNSAVAFGSINTVEVMYDQYGHPFEARFKLNIEHVLRGSLTNNVEVYEPVERFEALTAKMKFSGDFVFYLEPRTNGIGYLTYWTGFGVRPIDLDGKLAFQRQLRDFDRIPKGISSHERRQAMLEWGLRCTESRITAWDGIVAVRNALHPGHEFRHQERTRKLATHEVRNHLQKLFTHLRDEWKGDWQVANVLMEAMSFLVDDKLFHHEVRHHATELRNHPQRWAKTLDKFMAKLRARKVQTDQ